MKRTIPPYACAHTHTVDPHGTNSACPFCQLEHFSFLKRPLQRSWRDWSRSAKYPSQAITEPGPIIRGFAVNQQNVLTCTTGGKRIKATCTHSEPGWVPSSTFQCPKQGGVEARAGRPCPVCTRTAGDEKLTLAVSHPTY